MKFVPINIVPASQEFLEELSDDRDCGKPRSGPSYHETVRNAKTPRKVSEKKTC